MSKNDRKKAGLHKEISSIFKGVVIPRKDGGKESSSASISEHTEYAVPTGTATESQKNEVPKSYQAAHTLPEAEPAQELKSEPVEEPRVEPVEEPRVEPVEETRIEPVEEPRVEPVEESKAEPVEEPKVEPVEELKVEPIEKAKVEPVEKSKVEPVSTPKFITAQQSKVIPIQESEDELAQETKSEPVEESKVEPVSPPKFMTAQESKVVPIEESEVDPAKDSETEPAKLPKNEPAYKSKFKKDKKPKVIPVKESKKTGIDKISKKVSVKRSVVKIGSESSWKQITSKLFTAKPGAGGTKQKAMVVMVPVLFIALIIFVLKGGVFGTSVHNAQAGEENNASGVASSAGVNTQIDWEVPEAYPTTLRDPVKLGPVVTGANQDESGELVDLIVKSILYSEDNPSAIVGNRIVHEGDQIQDASVIKINKDSVEFEMNGKKWTQKIQR